MPNKKNKKATRELSFPYKSFPKEIQKIILKTNKHLSFPVDFISASILFAFSVSIGNTHKVEVRKGWLESVVLYIAIVGRAGTNKSHPLSFAINPILNKNIEFFNIYKEKLKEYNKVLAIPKGERKKKGIKDPILPLLKKILVSDYTPEALAQVLNANSKGIAVYADEIAGWFKNFNRYNNGSEMEFWLSVWNSKSISIDRKTGEPLLISHPFISVCGTIQNALLDELAKDHRMYNGFIERILFVAPNDLKKQYWSETEIDEEIFKLWDEVLNKALNLKQKYSKDNIIEPKVLKLSLAAKEILVEWQRKNTDRCNEKKNEVYGGIYSKMEIYAPRIALILQIMFWLCENDSNEEIEEKSMTNALTIVEYFTTQAIKVSKKVIIKTPVDKLPNDKKALYNALNKKFSTKEGVELASEYNIPERTFKDFLNKQELFEKISRGQYKKIYE